MIENRVIFDEPLPVMLDSIMRGRLGDYVFLVVDDRINEYTDELEWVVKAFTCKSDSEWLWEQKAICCYDGAMIIEFLSEEDEERLYGGGPFSTDVISSDDIGDYEEF